MAEIPLPLRMIERPAGLDAVAGVPGVGSDRRVARAAAGCRRGRRASAPGSARRRRNRRPPAHQKPAVPVVGEQQLEVDLGLDDARHLTVRGRARRARQVLPPYRCAGRSARAPPDRRTRAELRRQGAAHAPTAARPAATARFANWRWMRGIEVSFVSSGWTQPYQRPAFRSSPAAGPEDRPTSRIMAARMPPLDGLRVLESDPRAGRPLLRHAARRHGGRGPQDRGADARGRHARLGAAPATAGAPSSSA